MAWNPKAAGATAQADNQYAPYTPPVTPPSDGGAAHGTGFPSGSAPVGTEYVDDSATNGAVKWIYTPSGWRVSVGDTGWRRIDLSTPSEVSAGQVYVRRTAESALIRISNVITSNEGVLCPWDVFGFIEPLFQGEVVGVVRNGYGAVAQFWGGWNSLRLASTSPGDPYSGTVTIGAVAPGWPTSLPGTA